MVGRGAGANDPITTTLRTGKTRISAHPEAGNKDAALGIYLLPSTATSVAYSPEIAASNETGESVDRSEKAPKSDARRAEPRGDAKLLGGDEPLTREPEGCHHDGPKVREPGQL